MNRILTARALFVLSGLFIVYATTIPWDVVRAPSFDKVSWLPFWDAARGRMPSLPDIVQNVLLFLPFGFCGWFALDGARKRGGAAGALGIGLVGLGLSLLVEFLQTMSRTRTPSATDMAANFLGTWIGAGLGALYGRHLAARLRAWVGRTVREQPGLLVCGLYLAAVVLGSLAPFLPTLDVGALRQSMRQFLDDPWGPKPIGALWADGLLYMAVGFLAARELPAYLAGKSWFPGFKRRPIPPAGAALFATLFVSLLALALETAQIFIPGHSPGVQDAVTGIVCGGLGAGLAAARAGGAMRPATELGQLTRRAPRLVFAFALLGPALRALQPFEFEDLSQALQHVNAGSFVPFRSLFRNLNFWTLFNVFEASAVYLPLGYALFVVGTSPWSCFWMSLLVAEMLEVLQIPVVGRVFDVTEGIYAGFMGLVGAWSVTRLRELANAKAQGHKENPEGQR